MKLFLHILERHLNEKYRSVDFKLYILRSAKKRSYGFGSKYFIYSKCKKLRDIEELWILTRQDMKMKFILPLLINTTKWKYDYTIFKRNFV